MTCVQARACRSLTARQLDLALQRASARRGRTFPLVGGSVLYTCDIACASCP